MVITVPLWLLITLITLASSVAGFAAGCWRTASRSTRAPKRPATATSEPPSALASIQADQAALFSTLEKLSTTVKRLSSRYGMRDLAERRKEGPPPVGAPKAQLREYYGINGGPGQAEFQLQRERGEAAQE